MTGCLRAGSSHRQSRQFPGAADLHHGRLAMHLLSAFHVLEPKMQGLVVLLLLLPRAEIIK